MKTIVKRTDGVSMQVIANNKTLPIEENTDWDSLMKMTEEEIEIAASSDADNPPLTEKELSRMRKVPNPKDIRNELKMTQQQFAKKFELPIGTLRDWEQKVREPDNAAKSYLRVISKNPIAVIKALESYSAT